MIRGLALACAVLVLHRFVVTFTPVELARWCHEGLMSAAARNAVTELKVRLVLGPDDQRWKWASTPLVEAARTGNDEAVALLLAHGHDPRRRTKDGGDALDAARLGHHESTARLLAAAR